MSSSRGRRHQQQPVHGGAAGDDDHSVADGNRREERPGHIPVMLEETLRLLAPATGETFVDLTAGRGGHATAIADRLVKAGGRIVAFDLDPGNVDFVRRRLTRQIGENEMRGGAIGEAGGGGRLAIDVEHANFVEAPHRLRELGVRADMLLADLGFASTQMDDPARGFSFGLSGGGGEVSEGSVAGGHEAPYSPPESDAERGIEGERQEWPLDMRLNPEAPITAAMLVNESSERELADLIFRYGEEPLARKIAATIVAERKNSPILTTARLARLVRQAYGRRRAEEARMHPATRVFMALRIAVNDELAALESLWAQITDAVERLDGDCGTKRGDEHLVSENDDDDDVEVDGTHRERQANRREGEWATTSMKHATPKSPIESGETSSAIDSAETSASLSSSQTMGRGGWINPGARIVFIAFHSLEDRIVKRAMADLVRRGLAESLTAGRVKPLTPTDAELRVNPRSRSAKLRAIRVTGRCGSSPRRPG